MVNLTIGAQCFHSFFTKCVGISGPCGVEGDQEGTEGALQGRKPLLLSLGVI